GAAHLDRGDEHEAEVFLQRTLEADPTQILALKLLGEIAYRRDDLHGARARFEAALRLDPSDATVRERLGLILAEAGAQKEVRRNQTQTDRKSTRLNSSHGSISYAVFCLKKKRLNRRQ